jgi:hypothetical protein
MADKVKVVGYAQRVFFDNGIEYRNFSDDLVGQQFVSGGGSALFTSANFNITTNHLGKPNKIFTSNKFSNFICLEDLKTDSDTLTIIIDNNINPKLKLDRTNLCNYAFFGSLSEFIRVSLEDIILKWPASLYVTPITNNSFETGTTVDNYSYNTLLQTATFDVSTNRINNKYNIRYLSGGSTTTESESPLRDLSTSFLNYVISTDDGDFNVLGFTGATSVTDDTIYFKVEGDPFSASTATTVSYHIKPNVESVEAFFTQASDFQNHLLNRMVTPKYKATFRFPIRSDIGVVIYQDKDLTWPVTDGYNIDFDTSDYILYVGELIDIANNFDENKTNLIVRQLVSESISDFDTMPKCDGDIIESAGQKMNKTLKIYGREFDEIKRYIDGIKFANTVTYDGKDNMPDSLLKYLAKSLGWDMISSVLENDLLQTYLTPADPTYSGHSRGLTPYEAEIELWRRIILNSPWIWKSKGTRKVIEFFLSFIGTPKDLISFNEYVYKANAPLDVELVKDVIAELGLDDTILDTLNFDSDGYPRFFRNDANMYFQKGGLWYRQTGGSGSTVDILTGNNPHVGPYDGGKEYIDQLRCVIPDFQPVTVSRQVINTDDINIFTNYNSGLVNDTSDELSIEALNLDGVPISDCYEITSQIIEDPFPSNEITDCGCETGEGDEAIRVSITKIPPSTATTFADCGYSAFTLEEDGFVLFTTNDGMETSAILPECCEALNFDPIFIDGVGYYCAWNTPSDCTTYVELQLQANGIVVWERLDGTTTTVVDSPECCDVNKNYIAVLSPAGDGYNCKTPDCVQYQDIQVNDNGIVIWEKPDGTTTTIVDAVECCDPSLGYSAVPAANGGFECVFGKLDCSTFKPIQIQIDGVVVWEKPDGTTTTYVDSSDCCKNNGYSPITDNFGTQCVDSNAVDDADSTGSEPIDPILTKK